MDFFQQQDIARRNSRLLLVLFLSAVFLLIVLLNLVVAGFLYFNEDFNVYTGSNGGSFLDYFSLARFGSIGLGVTATVALVVLVRWIQLSSGGKSVAESMGGTRVLPQTTDPAQQRCLNVVEEMALAANMPVPAVYVMNDERGINAFAAGIVPADAVIGVTRGAIEHLKRDELQGVIGHEFSHILNGDMRLSIRLAAMLKGITFIGDVGHFLLRSSNRHRLGSSDGRSNSGGAVPLLGLALLLLGWIGGLAAGFIKAAISRQKEYLADASAVQFTRNPDSIASALKVIGGYVPGTLVHAARASEMSHIFFGQIEHHLWQMFATHPPLAQRIRRVDPGWDGQFTQRKPRHYAEEPRRREDGEVGVGRAAIVSAAILAGMEAAEQQTDDADFVATPVSDPQTDTADRHDIPVAYVRHSHEPLGAQAIVCSLLMSTQEATRGAQLSLLSNSGIRGLAELVNTIGPGVLGLGAPRRLPLLELCLPALRAMSMGQYRRFKNSLLQLIQADSRTELHEWCLFQLVRHYLDPEFIQVKPSRPRYKRLKQVTGHLQMTLSVLAHEGSADAAQAFRQGADELGFSGLQITPREQCSVAAFSKAVHELANCYPLLKPRVLKAMALAASADGELCPAEREIIASIAAVMDCPVPMALSA